MRVEKCRNWAESRNSSAKRKEGKRSFSRRETVLNFLVQNNLLSETSFFKSNHGKRDYSVKKKSSLQICWAGGAGQRIAVVIEHFDPPAVLQQSFVHIHPQCSSKIPFKKFCESWRLWCSSPLGKMWPTLHVPICHVRRSLRFDNWKHHYVSFFNSHAYEPIKFGLSLWLTSISTVQVWYNYNSIALCPQTQNTESVLSGTFSLHIYATSFHDSL